MRAIFNNWFAQKALYLAWIFFKLFVAIITIYGFIILVVAITLLSNN